MVLYIDGCYTRRVLLRQNQCVQTTTSVPLAQKARPQLANWARASDCLPLGSPHGRTGTAGLVPGSPPCLWCCHVSWVCLRPGACCLLEVLSSHTCPRASMSGLLLSSTRPARPWLKHLLLPLLLLSILLGLLWGTSVTLVLLIRKECRAHVLLPLGLSAGFLPQRSGVGGPLASPQLASGSFPMARCQQQGHPCSAPFRDVSAVPIGVGQQHQVRQRHACL